MSTHEYGRQSMIWTHLIDTGPMHSKEGQESTSSVARRIDEFEERKVLVLIILIQCAFGGRIAVGVAARER